MCIVIYEGYREAELMLKNQAPSAICTAQAAMLNVGDVGSGLSVLAVASWTAWSLSTPRKIAQKLFLLGLAGIWIVAFITSSIGPFIYGRKFYTAAGAWVSLALPLAWKLILNQALVLDLNRVPNRPVVLSLPLGLSH